jgi:hypothetical protein
MRITQEKLKEILASHGKWLRGENGGEKADLSNADLSCINLNHTDLRGANLCEANFYGANLYGANLCGANLCGANLCGADLRNSSLRATDLRAIDLSNSRFDNANLSTTSLSKTYYQIVRIGSREATTTYCVEDDNVRCGCWNNYGGGTLEEFKKRVESVYGEDGKNPNKKYYTQYMAAIEFFEKMAKLAKMEEG